MGSITLSVLCNNAVIANSTVGTDEWISMEHDTHREKPVPVPLCPTSIPHELAWDWTDAYKAIGYCMAWNCIWKEEYLQLAAIILEKQLIHTSRSLATGRSYKYLTVSCIVTPQVLGKNYTRSMLANIVKSWKKKTYMKVNYYIYCSKMLQIK
jgi:hypothetical protein